MLSISAQNSSNNKVNFKAKFEATDYLKSGFDNAIDTLKITGKANGCSSSAVFLNNIKDILNDGTNDNIKIAEKPFSEIKPSQAKPHNVFVNGKQVIKDNYSFGLIQDGPQCIEAIRKFAKKRGVDVDRHSAMAKKIDEMKTQVEALEIVYAQMVKKELEQIRDSIFKKG